MKTELQKADIILVATGADEPILFKRDVAGFGKKVIIDMSVPYNVERNVQELQNIEMINVDELSKIQDDTYNRRLAEVPKARTIIAERLTAFLAWVEMRRNIELIKTAKEVAVELMSNCSLNNPLVEDNTQNKLLIEKTVKDLVIKMKSVKQTGCIYIDAVNSFLKAS